MFHWMAVLVARYDSAVVAVILLVISAQNEVTEVTIAISSMVQYEHAKGFTTCVCLCSLKNRNADIVVHTFIRLHGYLGTTS